MHRQLTGRSGSDPAVPALSLRLFGPFEVRVNGQPLPRLRSRKGLSLLALLALRSPASGYPAEVERAWLAALLWPDRPTSQALATLRRDLTDLRRALGPAAARIQSPNPRTLSLNLAGAEVDVIAFDGAVAREDEGSWEAALAHYRGPLLQGWDAEWVFEERQVREEAYLRTLERLAAAATARGDPGAAEQYLRRAVSVDPLRETAHRALMQSLAAGGNYAAALLAYRDLRQRLHRELNAAPDPETQALFEQVRAEAREEADGRRGRGSRVLAAKRTAAGAGPWGGDEETGRQGDRETAGSQLSLSSVLPLPCPPVGPSPSDTLTFLFADIAGSTRLWEQYPDAMPEALARHETLLRQAIAAHGGHVFKTVGDQWCAAFPTAPAALHAALAAQQDLQGMRDEGRGMRGQEDPPLIPHLSSLIPDLRLRMALHTGTALEREGDYLGPALNRVARLLAAAHGGQILLSRATQELVREDLPEGASLRDLGTHRLKDLQQPEHLFQLQHPSLPAEFAPVRSLEAFTHNLPIQVTSFVGREEATAEVKRLLGATADGRRQTRDGGRDNTPSPDCRLPSTACRLVTLTGAGGCGKTRLALQVAADLLDGEDDGAWFVDLAPLTDPALVPRAVASVLGVREEPGRPLTQTLLDALLPKRLLLILDNCEHLIEPCAALAEALLRRCPGVQILATSRERLNIAGETAYRVPSLSLPPVEGGWALGVGDQGSSGSPNAPRLTPDALTQYEAVRLFIDRAVAALPGFAVTNANAPAVAEICHRLDGIPLAIELAAARVRVLSTEQIAARLDDRFRLLTGGSRSALPRQQTLRALIDWSYDLLAEPEKVLLQRLSVFAGGWTLEAAEAVCSGVEAGSTHWVGTPSGVQEGATSGAEHPNARTPERLNADAVLDLLTALVDKSLVVEEPGAEMRYWLLETVRQYARDRLLAGGAEEAVRSRHLEWFLALAERAEPELMGADQETWFGRLDAELDNIRAALAWALAVDPASALRLAGALWRFWEVRGYFREGRAALERGLEQGGDVPPEVRALGLRGAGYVAMHLGDQEPAQQLLEESLALSRALGDRRGVADSLSALGEVVSRRGDLQSERRLHAESLAIRREIGDRWGIGTSLLYLGFHAQQEGDVPSARQFLEEGLQVKREIGDQRGMAVALDNLGGIARAEGDYPAARRYFTEGLAIRRRMGDHLVAASLSNLGWAALEQGEGEEARTFFEEAMTVLRRAENKGVAIGNLTGLGYVALRQGDLATARASFEEGAKRSREAGWNHAAAEALRGLGRVAHAEGEDEGARALLQESLTLLRKNGLPRDIAAGLEALAHAAGPERAARLLGAAEALREAAGSPRPPVDRAACEHMAVALRAALGEEAFDAAWAAGRAMTREEAVRVALEESEIPTAGGKES